jgi:hypothetical protein
MKYPLPKDDPPAATDIPAAINRFSGAPLPQ